GAIGEIGADRADRRAKARADAVAGRKVGAHTRIPGIAGIEERGDAPVIADPARVFDAADGEAPAADDGTVVRHADALDGVAADRLVAAGTEQERARYALARAGAHAADLAAQQQIVIACQVEKERCTRQAAQEGLGGQRVRRAADLGGKHIALARRDDDIGAPERFAHAE